MPRQVSRTRSILGGGGSSSSDGFSIRGETSNVKRSLLLKPSSHSSHTTPSWISYTFVLFLYCGYSMVINTVAAVLFGITKSSKFTFVLLMPNVINVLMGMLIVFLTGYVYHKVFKLGVLMSNYLLLLSYAPAVPLLLTERLFFLILAQNFLSLHVQIFHLATLIVMGTVSQYIIRININPKIDPPSTERSDFIRNLTLLLGQALSSICFYYLVMSPDSCSTFFSPAGQK